VASNRVPAMVDDALCASTEVNADIMVVSFVYLSHEKTKSISD